MSGELAAKVPGTSLANEFSVMEGLLVTFNHDLCRYDVQPSCPPPPSTATYTCSGSGLACVSAWACLQVHPHHNEGNLDQANLHQVNTNRPAWTPYNL